MLGWRKHKLESRLPGKIAITSDYHPYGRKQRGTKEPLDESERGEWKIWLEAQRSENEDHGIQSHHFMAKGWGNSGNSGWFILGGSKITADGDCNHEIRRRLLLGRKVMTNLDSILKSRDITLPTKVCLVKAICFSSSHVWMWELDYKESWEPKNWCFWTVVWRRLLRVPWTVRRSNQSILKEISPGCSLEGLM